MTLRQKISDIPLYLQILIGMITGIIIGLIALQVDGGDTFIRHLSLIHISEPTRP